MTLTVRNEQGQTFLVYQKEYDGFEIFQMADVSWSHWHTYQVLDGTRIIEEVINPREH